MAIFDKLLKKLEHDEDALENEVEAESEQPQKKLGFGTGLFVGLSVGICIALLVTMLMPKICAGIKTSTDTETVLDADTIAKVNNLKSIIDHNYYEDVDVDQLRDGIYKGLFKGIGDKYSEYYTAEECKAVFQSTGGYFGGIGAVLTQDPDTMQVTVISVYDDSPAQESGMQADDIIVSGDGYLANTMSLSEFVNHLRGDVGTSVHVKVYRPSEGKYIDMDITRSNIEFDTAGGVMLEDTIGYIQIIEFADSTPAQFEKTIKELRDEGADRFIIDLRSNPGGVLTAAVKILDTILPEGVLVSTRSKDNQVTEYKSDAAHIDEPFVVLINEKSASASEVFAGAVRDYKAGELIGTKTFGKGIVQTIRQLKDGSAYKLTTSRYFSPNGENIHGVGITPDIELEYKWDDSEEEKMNYLRDNQVVKAIEILKSKK